MNIRSSWLCVGFSWVLLACGALHSDQAYGQTRSHLSASLRTYGFTASSASDPLSSARKVSLSFTTGRHESIVMSTGYSRFMSFPEHTPLEQFGRPSWKMRAVPITVSYRYTFTKPGAAIAPYVDAGGSLYLFKVRTYYEEGTTPPVPMRDETAFTGVIQSRAKYSDVGAGFGAHVEFGLRTHVSEHLFLSAQGGVRFIDGPGMFTYEAPDEFFKVGFSLGVGVDL